MCWVVTFEKWMPLLDNDSDRRPFTFSVSVGVVPFASEEQQLVDGFLDEFSAAYLTVDFGQDPLDFLIDTGFNGHLAVSELIVRTLDLELKDIQTGITADGRSSDFDTVDLHVTWHGRTTVVRAQVLDEPLLGTRMLRGGELQAVWKSGSRVTINECPSPEAR